MPPSGLPRPSGPGTATGSAPTPAPRRSRCTPPRSSAAAGPNGHRRSTCPKIRRRPSSEPPGTSSSPRRWCTITGTGPVLPRAAPATPRPRPGLMSGRASTRRPAFCTEWTTAARSPPRAGATQTCSPRPTAGRNCLVRGTSCRVSARVRSPPRSSSGSSRPPGYLSIAPCARCGVCRPRPSTCWSGRQPGSATIRMTRCSVRPCRPCRVGAHGADGRSGGRPGCAFAVYEPRKRCRPRH